MFPLQTAVRCGTIRSERNPAAIADCIPAGIQKGSGIMAAKKPAKTEKAAPVTGAQEEKLKALEHALADLDKQFGKGAVMKLGEHAEQNVQVIPTGCLTLDEALGVGGIPPGILR